MREGKQADDAMLGAEGEEKVDWPSDRLKLGASSKGGIRC